MISLNNLEAQCGICDEAKIKYSETVQYVEFIKMIKVMDPDRNQISFIEDISDRN